MKPSKTVPPFPTLREALRARKIELVTRALHHTNGNRQQAAKLLGLSRSAVWNIVRRERLQVPLPQNAAVVIR